MHVIDYVSPVQRGRRQCLATARCNLALIVCMYCVAPGWPLLPPALWQGAHGDSYQLFGQVRHRTSPGCPERQVLSELSKPAELWLGIHQAHLLLLKQRRLCCSLTDMLLCIQLGVLVYVSRASGWLMNFNTDRFCVCTCQLSFVHFTSEVMWMKG